MSRERKDCTEMADGSMCPLHGMRPCQRAKCEWWLKNVERCAVRDMALSLQTIAHSGEALHEQARKHNRGGA